jgi:DNA polymerase II small subunit/DNA polymerase delta subunit B
MVEAMSGGEKPNIVAVGHYHKAEYLFYRNVHCFQTGCFQAQTPFMRGKNLAAMMGGWIVDVTVAKDGSVLSITPEFIPFYKAIKDDYKNWRPK